MGQGVTRRAKMEKIVILTGAGISAESGLGTFRDEGGLWAQHRIEDVATPEGFARDPALVHQFYNARRVLAAKARPNAAHAALTRLQMDFPGEVVIVTQNVDSLHESGGAERVIHMHGTLAGAFCPACNHRWTSPPEMAVGEPCPDRATGCGLVWRDALSHGRNLRPSGRSDPVCCHRHLGSGLSSRRLRSRSLAIRRPHSRTEPRTLNRSLQF